MAFTHLTFDSQPFPPVHLELLAGVSLSSPDGKLTVTANCTDEQAELLGQAAAITPQMKVDAVTDGDDERQGQVKLNSSPWTLTFGPLPAAGMPNGSWQLGSSTLTCQEGVAQIDVPVVRDDLVGLLSGGVRGFPERRGVEVLFTNGAMLGRLVSPPSPQHPLEALAAHEGAFYAGGLVRAFPPPLEVIDNERALEIVRETLDGDMSLLEDAREGGAKMAEMVRLEYSGLDRDGEVFLMGHLQQLAIMLSQRSGQASGMQAIVDWITDAEGVATHGLLVGSRLARTELALQGVDTSLDVQLAPVAAAHVPVGVVLPRMYLLEATGDSRAQRIFSLDLTLAQQVEQLLIDAIDKVLGDSYEKLEMMYALCFAAVDLGVRWQLARCCPERLLGDQE